MLVDDKLAKEKLILEVVRILAPKTTHSELVSAIELIRNTDLTDCQQPAPVETEVQHVCGVSGFAGSGDVCPRCELNARKRSASANAAWETRKGLIAPAPDQGSVRNATDMREALQFYADPKNYDEDGVVGKETIESGITKKLIDRGNVARKAL